MNCILTNNLSLKKKRRFLRMNQTYAEYFLWSKLRNKQLNGNKFYRQFSVGPYILDFYCFDKKVAIELDGGQHAETGHQLYDHKRIQFLNQQEIKVIRFWDNEVIKNRDGVLETIQTFITSISNSP